MKTKSWKTNLVGAALIIAGIVVFLQTKDWAQAGLAITVGIGFFLAKDNNVTGGTIQQ